MNNHESNEPISMHKSVCKINQNFKAYDFHKNIYVYIHIMQVEEVSILKKYSIVLFDKNRKIIWLKSLCKIKVQFL